MHIVLFRYHSLSVQNNSVKEQLKQCGARDWLGRRSQDAYNSFTSVMLPNILLIRKTFGWIDGAGTITKRRPALVLLLSAGRRETWWRRLVSAAFGTNQRANCDCIVSHDSNRIGDNANAYMICIYLKYSVDILHEQLILFISNLLLQIQWTGDN